MLQHRLAGCVLVRNGIVVQSIGFARYLPVGRPEIAVEFLTRWGIDEIILLDMTATPDGRGPGLDRLKRSAARCFVPLTVGGGIRSLQQMHDVIRCGADKFSINAAALDRPELIREAAAVFGNQCVVVAMDVRKTNDGRYAVCRDGGQTLTSTDPVAWAQKAAALGAGEILVNAVHCDGMKAGYDLDLIRRITAAVSIPVIALGGAGHPDHFRAVLEGAGASAAAAGNFFHFTEHSPITVKAFLRGAGSAKVRLDTHAHYEDVAFDFAGRIAKRDDDYLEKIRFEIQPKEVI